MEVSCTDCSSFSRDGTQCNDPVINAVRNGHDRCLKLLVDVGADVSATDMCDLGLLSINPASSEQPLRFITRTPANSKFKYMCTALIYAARQGDYKCTKLLLESGANVNSVITFVGFSNNFRLASICGSSALIFASRFGHYKCVKLLIESGADLNITSQDGCTALIASTIFGDTKIAKLILISNGHINQRITIGHNALTTAITSCLYQQFKGDIIMLLYAAGEILNDTTFPSKGDFSKRKTEFSAMLPRTLRNIKEEWCVKHLCRETIRNHLINLNPKLHLFHRIPKLELPSSLTKYLLYNITLHS